MSEKIQKIRPDGSVFTVLLHWDKITEKLRPEFVIISVESCFHHHPEKFIAEVQIIRTEFVADKNRFHYCAIVKVERPGIAIMTVLHQDDLSGLFLQAMGIVSNILNSGINGENLSDFMDGDLSLTDQADDSSQDYLPPHQTRNDDAKQNSRIEGKINWTAFERDIRGYKPKEEK